MFTLLFPFFCIYSLVSYVDSYIHTHHIHTSLWVGFIRATVLPPTTQFAMSSVQCAQILDQDRLPNKLQSHRRWQSQFLHLACVILVPLLNIYFDEWTSGNSGTQTSVCLGLLHRYSHSRESGCVKTTARWCGNNNVVARHAVSPVRITVCAPPVTSAAAR